jgi:hypothetical protein
MKDNNMMVRVVASYANRVLLDKGYKCQEEEYASILNDLIPLLIENNFITIEMIKFKPQSGRK